MADMSGAKMFMFHRQPVICVICTFLIYFMAVPLILLCIEEACVCLCVYVFLSKLSYVGQVENYSLTGQELAPRSSLYIE